MADYTISASDVEHPSRTVSRAVAGVTITAGQLIYIDAADSNKAKLAQCDVSDAQAAVVGMAVCNATAGQPVLYVSSGDYEVGSQFTTGGKVLALSAAAGKIADVADILTTERLVLVGYSKDDTTLHLDIKVTGEMGTTEPP